MASKPTIGGWLAGAVLIGTLYMLVIPDDHSPDQNVDYSGGVKADTAVLRDLLDRRQFDALEAELDRLIDAYTQGVDNTEAYTRGFGTFEHVDLTLQAPLDDWVGAHPDRFEPYFARSIYYLQMGSAAGSSDSMCDDGPDRRKAQDEYVKKARADAEQALSLRPDIGGVYAVLIVTAAYSGDKAGAEALMRQGLAADPRSYWVRYYYLDSLSPNDLRERLLIEGRLNWDYVGAFAARYGELSDYLDEVADDANSYPWLKRMLGRLDSEVALSESILGLTDKALDRLDAAEAKGGTYDADRAAVLYSARRYEDLIRLDAVASDRLDPGERLPAYLVQMTAEAYGNLGQPMRAVKYFDRLLERDPDHPVYLYFRADYLRHNLQMDQAWDSINRALVLGETHGELQFLAGEMHFSAGDATAAVPYFKRAAELAPSNPEYFYYWAKAQFEPDFCLSRRPARKFLELCEEQGCKQSEISWARTVLQLTSRATACSATD